MLCVTNVDNIIFAVIISKEQLAPRRTIIMSKLSWFFIGINCSIFASCELVQFLWMPSFLLVLKIWIFVKGCDCWWRRCWEVESDPALLPGSVHLVLQENHRGGFPGEGGHSRHRRPGEAHAVGHGGPGGVWRYHPGLLQVKTATSGEKWKNKNSLWPR